MGFELDAGPGNDETRGEATVVRNGMRYRLRDALLLATDEEPSDPFSNQNTKLYRTPRGNYFLTHPSADLFDGPEEIETVEPLTPEAALAVWEKLLARKVEFEKAFPGFPVDEA